jgi:glutathione peroxidase
MSLRSLLAAGALLLAVLTPAPAAENPAVSAVTSPLSFTVTANDGKPYDLNQHLGKVVLLVNTASKCGFTKQYAGLQSLYEKYSAKGLVVIGFPANDFGKQEPGSNEEIGKFCKLNFGVTFPLMAKSEVTGDNKSPLYKYLTEQSPKPGAIKWNFSKFLVDRSGKVVERYASPTDPLQGEVVATIERLLAEPAPATKPEAK